MLHVTWEQLSPCKQHRRHTDSRGDNSSQPPVPAASSSSAHWMELLLWLLVLFWGYWRTCSVFTSTQSPSRAESRGKHSCFGFEPIFLSHKNRMVWVAAPATDSNSRCHCRHRGPLPAVHSNTGMEVTTATNKTFPQSGDVGCSGEGTTMVDTGTTAHLGERSWETHQLHGVSQVCQR